MYYVYETLLYYTCPGEITILDMKQLASSVSCGYMNIYGISVHHMLIDSDGTYVHAGLCRCVSSVSTYKPISVKVA